jgi:hypothetical protein
MLAIAPRHLLDHYAAVWAIDAPHAVQQENQNSPERDEFKAPLREMIIAGRQLVATRAHCRGTNSRPNANFDGFLVGGKSVVVVNESPKTVAVI